MAKRFIRNWFSNELEEVEHEPSPTGRAVIARETLRYGLKPSRRQPAISSAKPHVSRALGIPPQQADRHNKYLRQFGITNAAYSKKTGFLESTEREDRAAAWAVRGYSDNEGGFLEDKYAAAIGL